MIMEIMVKFGYVFRFVIIKKGRGEGNKVLWECGEEGVRAYRWWGCKFIELMWKIYNLVIFFFGVQVNKINFICIKGIELLYLLKCYFFYSGYEI